MAALNDLVKEKAPKKFSAVKIFEADFRILFEEPNYLKVLHGELKKRDTNTQVEFMCRFSKDSY